MTQRLASAWLCAASVLVAGPASSQDFSILHYEPLENFQLEDAVDSGGEPAPDLRLLSFTAFGRQFAVRLRDNERMLHGLNPAQAAAVGHIKLYTGVVEGLPDSWARFAVVDGIPTGVLWDGSEVYAIQKAEDVTGLLTRPDTLPPAQLIVYRRSDAIGRMSDIVVDPLRNSTPVTKLPATASAKPTPALSPTRQLDVGIIVDQELAEREGQNTEAYLLGIVNIVEGIYVWQVGIYLNVDEIRILDSGSDPFASNDPTLLLRELEDYKESSPALRVQGLTHLFTGRDLTEPNGQVGQTVGLANIGVLCSARYGVGLSQATHDAYTTALIAAHEIGHNFGAPHDTEPGSMCESAPPNYLMDDSLSGGSTFSTCSINQMKPEIDAAACLRDLLPSDLSVRLVYGPPAVRLGETFEAIVAIDNVRSEEALQVELSVAADNLNLIAVAPLDPDAWQCDATALPVSCWSVRLGGGESAEFAVTLESVDTNGGTLHAEVASENDPDSSNNHLAHVFDVPPFVDLVTTIPGGDILLHPGEERQIRFEVRNDGLETATDVQMELDLASGHEVLLVTPSSGTCEMIDHPGRQLCSMGNLVANGAAYVDVVVRAEQIRNQSTVWDRYSVYSEVSSTEEDFDPSDNAEGISAVNSARFVDLDMTFSGPAVIEAGTQVQFDVRIANLGPEEATTVRLDMRHYFGEFGFSQVAVEDAAEACMFEVIGAVERVFCEVPRMLPGDSLELTVTGLVPEQEHGGSYFYVQLFLWQPEWDLDPSTNSVTHDVEIVTEPVVSEPPPEPETPPPPEPPAGPSDSPPVDGDDGMPSAAVDSSGGGGAAGLLWLASLFAAAVLYRSSRSARALP